MENPVILIVDDERSNQFLLEGLLGAHGYKTIVACNGVECMQILSTQLVDLILLDIMMPKMTGIEALEIINASDNLKHIPVLILSAKTSTNDIEIALGKGAIDYIRKPFDEIELLSRVKVGIRLKQNEDHLREMIRQREELVSIVSHDLRSPFAAINGFAELIIGDKNLTKEQKDSLSFIIDSVTFSQDYFNKLLSWSKLEHQNILLTLTPVSISKIIDVANRIFEAKATAKEIKLINEVDEKIIVKIDNTYFRQVVGNLISNAIKFTNRKGKVRCFSMVVEGGIEIVVSDTGIGMPEDLTPEILFTANILKSRRGTVGEKGTGLGISICKKITDAHHFQISFRKNRDNGTDFVICIPNELI
jgi:two-component system, sensor histidine kinase and response regulator